MYLQRQNTEQKLIKLANYKRWKHKGRHGGIETG